MNDLYRPLRFIRSMSVAEESRPAFSRRPRSRTSQLLCLEQRFMFDAAAVATAVDAAHALPDAHALALIPDVCAPVQVREADVSVNHGKKEVVFIDTSVTHYQTLEASVRAGIEIQEISHDQSGLAQIAKWAESHRDYDAIHIISHGSDAMLFLGSDAITQTSLATPVVQAELAELGHAIKTGGDLLIYGCDVAQDNAGLQWTATLAQATGADVAASSDDTGAQNLGGNWILEKHTGQIDVASAFDSSAIQSYSGLLTTFDLSGASGDGTKVVQQTSGSDTLVITTTNEIMVVGDKSTMWDPNTVATSSTSGTVILTSNGGDLSGGHTEESKITLSISGGKIFDLASFTLVDISGAGQNLKITTNKGNQSWTSAFTDDYSWVVSLSGTTFQGISYAEITTDNSSLFTWGFDNFVLNNITVATPAPTVTDAQISITSSGAGTAGVYKVGDTVTASWNNTAGGDNNSSLTGVTMDFSQFGGGSAVVASESGHVGTWIASYTITAGSIDTTNRNVSVSATNSGGTTTTADTTNLSVDNQVPIVTDAKISISGATGTGGAYKIGDTVTATWNNTGSGDNNTDGLASSNSVTMNFSAFGGGSAVVATNSAGTWTATYTITSGVIDNTSRNVSVSVTDNAGNTTTTSDTTNATVDNIAPTVTDAKINISGATGTGGAYKIGDTVTASWNNTGSGDNNSDTLAGVTVDFSQFGGGSAVVATNSSGTWTATYTLVAGIINGTANRNVSFAVTDNAGNVTTTADSTNATVDNVAPTITFSSLAFSADTGTSSSDFITATAAQTITATLSGAPAGTDIVYGSLNNGATWTDITNQVSGTALTWNGVTLTSSGTLQFKVIDVTGNDGTVTSQAYVLDTTAPTTTITAAAFSVDTGSSGTDFITNTAAQTVSGTLSATIVSGEIVSVSLDNGATWSTATTSVGQNTWSLSGQTLTASNTLKVKVVDTAGNSGTVYSQMYIFDTSAPTGLGLSATTIAASSATSTSTIATLSATDGQTITYSLATGNGTNDADNGSFTISGTSLKVGGSSLSAGTYHVYVAATDTAGNAANQAFAITVVDAPSVSAIVRTGGASATASGSATSLSYTVTFSESVTGVDATDFSLTPTGTASGSIASISGSGTTYTVIVDSLSGDGTLRLDLNNSGTGIQNGSNINIAAGYTSGSTYTLDHTNPNTPSTPDMASGSDSGSSNTDNITSNTTPTFTGTAESGSTVTLYDTDGTTVLGTTTATGGNWSITASTLSAGSHTIKAKATDAASNTSSASSGLNVTIDISTPTVTSVSVPSSGSYRAGQTLSFTVNADEAIIVDTSGGTPRLALTIGSTIVYANYVSGSGSSALVFDYTVQSGDTDSNGIAVGALQSNGGTLKDAAGNNTTLTLNSVADTISVLVDTTAPTVNSVSVPSDATYYSNQHLDLTVNFSEAVTVGGTPYIALIIGSTAVHADYLSGSGTSALVFRYTVLDGQGDTDGIAVGALSLNSGTIADAAGNDATLTLNSVASTASVLVDANAPHIADVTSTTTDGSYKTGDVITITVTFDKVVNVDTTGGTPTLTLNSGGVANYVSGSGSTSLVFSYTVTTGDHSVDLDYSATDSLALNGSTIADSHSASLNASLTLPTPSASGSLGDNKAIVIDAVAPTITFSNLAFSADTGSSSTDFITSETAQIITATLSAAPANDDVVYGSLDNGAHWVDITNKISGTALTWDNVTLTDSGTLKFKVTDSLGNDGTITSQVYTLESAPINTPSPSITPAPSPQPSPSPTPQPSPSPEPSPSPQPSPSPNNSGSSNDTTPSPIHVAATHPPVPTPAPVDGQRAPTEPPVSFLSVPTNTTIPFLSTSTEHALDRATDASLTNNAPENHPGMPDFTPSSNGHFPILVLNDGAQSKGLMLNRGMADQVIASTGNTEISVPADAFAHTNPDALIQLSAQQANGRPLPNWVNFDARTGKFVVKVPPGLTGELAIKVVARDTQGHEVSMTFKVRINSKDAGRVSLSEQIRLATARSSRGLSAYL